MEETKMVKFPFDISIKVDTDTLPWIASFITKDEEIPLCVVKYITIIAAG